MLFRSYDPRKGGDPILWQHLFWFFGHPEVYVVLLPAVGIVAEIITVFSRKKLFAYKTVLYTAFGTGVLSFFVWAHHQFIAGIDPRMANIFIPGAREFISVVMKLMPPRRKATNSTATEISHSGAPCGVRL